MIHSESYSSSVNKKLLKELHSKILMDTQNPKEKINHERYDVNQKDLLEGAAYAIQICRRYLIVLGVWQPINAEVFSWRIILRYISIIIYYFGIGIRLVPMALYLIFDEKRSAERLRLTFRCAFIIVSAIEYNALRFNRNDIKKRMKDIELDWLKLEETTSRDIMMKHAKFGHFLTNVYAAFIYAAAVLVALLPIAASRFRDDNTHIVNVTEKVAIKSFAIPSHFGFSVFSETPFYQIIYTSQVMASFMVHSITVSCYSLTVVIVMHACGEMKILVAKLNELVDWSGKMTIFDNIDSRMSDIVKHHVNALRFVSFSEKMMRGIFLAELGVYSFLLCCMGYFILLEIRNEHKHPIAIFTWVFAFSACTFKAFAMTYVGELLTQEFTNVAEASYMIDWYRLPGKKSLQLGLVIAMAHRPVTLTAGGHFQLSIKCFANIMQTTLGYLNIIRSVID